MREAISIGIAFGLIMCGQEEAPVAPIAAPPTVLVAPPAPAHGGTVLMAGQTPLEVVTAPSGQVHAYALGPTPAPPGANVTVRLPDARGATHPVMLTWDPGISAFHGRCHDFHPVAGPIEVVYVQGGQTYQATAPTYVLVGPPVIVAQPQRPQVIVAQPQRPQVVFVEREPPPPPTIFIGGPPPPPMVVVEPPRPGVVYVERRDPRPVVVGPPGRMRHEYGDDVVIVNPGHGGGHGNGHGHGHW